MKVLYVFNSNEVIGGVSQISLDVCVCVREGESDGHREKKQGVLALYDNGTIKTQILGTQSEGERFALTENS